MSRLLLCLVALVFLLYSTQFPSITAPNERTRLYLAVALVDHGTLSIDEPVARFGMVLDAARFEGRLYTDKAPGSSLLAALVYGACRLFTEPADWSIEALLTLARRGIMVPLGVLGAWFMLSLLRRSGVGPRVAWLVTLGWLLGSAAFHYSTAFYGHQIVAVALLGALLAADHAEARSLEGARGKAAGYAALAGAAAGLAGLTEYQAGILCLLLTGYVCLGPLRRSVTALLAYGIGALPALVLLGLYNTHAFGGPFELSYHHLADAGLSSIHGVGVGGVTTPTLDGFLGSTFSLHRGLFTTSPLFLLAVPGTVVLWRRGRRRLAALAGAALAGFLLFTSSSNMWVAGWGFGPRLLVPVLPWALVLVAQGAQRLSGWALGDGLVRGLVGLGLVQHQLVQATFSEPPVEAHNPLFDVVLPALRAGIAAPNLGSELFDLSARASLVPLAMLAGALWIATLTAPLAACVSWKRVLATLLALALPVAFFALLRALGPSEAWVAGKGFEHTVLRLAR